MTLIPVRPEASPLYEPVNEPVSEEPVIWLSTDKEDKVALEPLVISFFQLGIIIHYGWLQDCLPTSLKGH